MNQMPETAKDAILASLSDSIFKQYNSGLKRWWDFCLKRNCDPFKANATDIVTFLSLELKKGASSGSLNTFRSAISLILGPDIVDDFRIKRFMKGVYNLRPQKPKYDITWDPKIALVFFEKQEANKDLTLKKLSKKLITLLALITAHRMQTFSFIEIDNIEIFSEKIIIKIPERIKTTGKNRLQPVLTIPFFRQNCKVCAADALVTYLNRTKDLRVNEKHLFISFQSPYKKVGSQTLSNWVTETLALAGLDTNVFSAHSTRHASTSTAKSKGVSLDLIKRTAGWTANSSTFAKFYDRNIIQEKDSFASAIYTRQDNNC